MMSMRASLPSLLLAGMLCALNSQPGPVRAQTPVKGGTLVAVSNPNEPAVLTAAFNQTGDVAVISTKIFDGLIHIGDNFKPEPELASSWDIAEDGKQIRFHLRSNVKWHDGVPFTAADVKFSFDEVWTKIHPRGRSTFAAVEAVDTPDPLTVVFKLKNPSGVIFSALSSGESQILPKHLYEGTDILKNPWNSKPVGTGPFRFKEWVRGDYILLERNPDYWDKGKPYLGQLIFRIIPDKTARYAAFTTGTIQYGALSPISIIDLERAQKDDRLQVEFKGNEWLGSRISLEFNVRRPPFSDVNVRRAVAYALDLQALSKLTTRGLGKPGTSPIISTHARFYSTDVSSYPLDLKRAEQLLDAAGYPRKPDGTRLSVSLDWLPFGEQWQRTGEFIRQSLRRVGIDVELRSQDMARFMQRVYTDNDFDFIVSHWASFGDPQIGTVRNFWSKAILKGVPWSNASGYSNPELDKIVEAAQKAPTEEQRVELFRQFQKIAMSDIPIYVLLENRLYSVASRRVHGLSTSPDGAYDSLKNVWLSE
jgi:peptide/nickel transport system substrate-binding protein